MNLERPRNSAEPSIRYGEKTYLALSADTVRLADDFRGMNFSLERPRPGMSLFMCEGLPEKDIASPFSIDGDGVITFSVILSGLMEYSAGKGKTGMAALDVRRAQDFIFTSAQCDGVQRMGGGRLQSYVGLNMSLESLHQMLDDASLNFSSAQKPVERGIHLLRQMPSNEGNRRIAAQILSCTLAGCCRRLFMEGKCLELLSSMITRLSGKKEENNPSFTLSRGDVERLHEARRILIENMEDPPGLQSLARQCGLNEFKLKRGFRKLFGCTAYEVLRSHRMHTARALLLDSEITVGTAASMVGYTNMSHFIAAFKKEFGVTPGTLLSGSRGKKQYVA